MQYFTLLERRAKQETIILLHLCLSTDTLTRYEKDPLKPRMKRKRILMIHIDH